VDIYNVSDGSWSTATLSQARYALAATSVGSLVLFGGGYNSIGVSNLVDIYNGTSNTWITATLSQARCCLAAVSIVNRYALFAGGYDGSSYYNSVDIYDTVSGTWTSATLSQIRAFLAATSLGNLSFFGGGQTSTPSTQALNTVDIFNATTNTWSTANLSQARYYLAAASVGDIIAFGGGSTGDNNNPSSVVDIYNVSSNIWSTLSLNQSRYGLAATSSTDIIFFGGGEYNNYGPQVLSDMVDIFYFGENYSIAILSPQSSKTTLSSSTPTLGAVPNSVVPSVIPSVTTTNTTVSTSMMTTTPTHNSPSHEQSANNTANNSGPLLAGILSAVALLIIAAIILLIVVLRKKRKQTTTQNEKRYDENVSMTDNEKETVLIESVTSANILDETKSTTLSTYQPGTETLRGLSPCQISLNELEIGREIGQGTYGRVCVGKWKKYRVALKFCQNKGKMDEFLREAGVMISLPPHPNVVRMYGVSMDGTQPIIVMEYCDGGSLDNLLFDVKPQISDNQKIRWVYDIAMGMCHLHKHNIVHRDLAARNILLSRPYPNEMTLKISDFGMSRVLQQDIEEKTLNKIGPIRWMAPESIRDQIYSKKSDVWMFGILVYEIVAQREPHTAIDPKDIPILIRDKGLTPVIPNNCPGKLRELMQMCWKKQPEQRPTFEVICTMLEQ